MVKNVHGISLHPHPDAFITSYNDVVRALTTTFEIGGCAVSFLSADGIVGYKGGTIERQLLIEIGMYRYDIGALGCHKIDVVLAAMSAVGRLGDPCHECARYQRYPVTVRCSICLTTPLDLSTCDNRRKREFIFPQLILDLPTDTLLLVLYCIVL